MCAEEQVKKKKNKKDGEKQLNTGKNGDSVA